MARDNSNDIIKMDIWIDGASSPTIKQVWKRLRTDLSESTNNTRNEICPVCKGKKGGYRNIDGSEWHRCKNCNGSGKFQ